MVRLKEVGDLKLHDGGEMGEEIVVGCVGTASALVDEVGISATRR